MRWGFGGGRVAVIEQHYLVVHRAGDGSGNGVPSKSPSCNRHSCSDLRTQFPARLHRPLLDRVEPAPDVTPDFYCRKNSGLAVVRSVLNAGLCLICREFCGSESYSLVRDFWFPLRCR